MLKLIIGIGNPGPEYQDTRHNAGAWFIDALCQDQHLDLRLEKKFALELANLPYGGHNIIIAKSTSFMNHSGQALGAYAKFFNIKPEEILVAHDELDLDPGVIRLKLTGGHGGHNGLRDILSHLGSANFCRLRIGIGHPGHKDLVHDYVLHRPSKEDKSKINTAISHTLNWLPEMLQGKFDKVMQELHAQ